MPQILGQPRALEILSNALRSARFPHAWIFSGPRGVGKFTTALQVARVLLDAQASPDLDGQVQNPKSKIQNLIDSNTHPDLHIIRKELALYSDNAQLRERKLMNIPLDLLCERMLGGKTGDDRTHEAPAYRTPTLGHGKVFIIDEAELLDANAQNSMLKTLEEPPPQTYFFLITSQPDRLLPTIRSRCQQVRFTRLDAQSMREWFKRDAAQDAEPGTRNSELVSWIEHFADGSPGAAQLALEYGFFQWRQTLKPMLAELERGQFPAAMGETLAALIEEFALAWVKSHKNASKDAANKDGAKHMFSLLATHLRSKLNDAIQRGAEASQPMAMIDMLREAERQLESNVNLKLLLENLVAQLAQAGTAVSLSP